MSELILPFKPYTLDEVHEITGIPSRLLDKWVAGIPSMRLQMGEDSSTTMGWTHDQAFAAFVGYRYIQEGAEHDRAMSIMVYLVSVGNTVIEQNLDAGCDFATVFQDDSGKWVGTMMPCPDKSLAQRLRLDKFWKEFRVNVDKVIGGQ